MHLSIPPCFIIEGWTAAAGDEFSSLVCRSVEMHSCQLQMLGIHGSTTVHKSCRWGRERLSCMWTKSTWLSTSDDTHIEVGIKEAIKLVCYGVLLASLCCHANHTIMLAAYGNKILYPLSFQEEKAYIYMYVLHGAFRMFIVWYLGCTEFLQRLLVLQVDMLLSCQSCIQAILQALPKTQYLLLTMDFTYLR